MASLSWRRVVVVAVCALATSADATVTQVDGTILPVMTGTACAGNIQVCLNTEEGGATINAVLDASQLPEVFLPNLTGNVTFKDVGEGAGFENSFGYYNVGDDVTNPANLHPILGCGVSAATHTGEASGYVVNAEPPNVATVNFATELAAGRYEGGFIGFYLLTPEGNLSAQNCGDFVNGTDGLSLFGRIYFTQRDLNNDGDFVHSLTYTSVTFADRFYFGFEDLFRGGDNDFEDMLIAVTGLEPPCAPSGEICDNLDNDCDGVVDDAPSDVGEACTCNGVGMTCVGGARQGVCQTGVTVCTAGGVEQCTSTVSPSGETCNALDDNCNGTVDDAPSGTGAACDGTDADACNEGVTICSAGALSCNDTTGANVEVCNGADDDCDGMTDEGVTGLGAACDGADGDACLEGVTTCSGGVVTCTDATATTNELCNGVDDDCDGVADDSPTDVGLPCTVGVGECQRNGATVCSGGTPTCNVSPGAPTSELCDGNDNDCDGSIDEGYNVGAACDGVGACGPGVIECATLTSTECSTDPGGSMSGATAEVCNLIDDDCDGSVDEGLNDLGPCGTETGECAEGRVRCIGGAEVCVGSIGPTPELCDALDNDCDALVDERTGDPGDAGGGLVDEGATCGDDTGSCEFGAIECTAGVPTCTGGVGPSPELCNGLDDDCNAITDDSPTDVGATCGATDVGECSSGTTICLAGAPACTGEIGPSVEICDGLDNDCDGTTDDDPLGEGAPCGAMLGVCVAGVNECVGGTMTCVGATGGTTEECNGLDDDCDGVIDDSPTGVGEPCGVSIPPCEPGTTFCISGAIQCVGGVEPTTEVCNALDDDCDMNVDEGDLCSGATCIDGECAAPCDPGEFSCPAGQICIEGFCLEDPCFGVACPPVGGVGQICQDGVCVDVCATVTCGGDDVCRPSDGLCVPDDCRFLPDKCSDDELCIGGECVADPCAGVDCPADEFCVGGACRESCAGVDCPAGQRCSDGACVPTGCGAACPGDDVCIDGMCQDSPCETVVCGEDEVCRPTTGECVTDPCIGVTCPSVPPGQVCELGECVSTTETEYVYASGGGCGVSGRAAGIPAALLCAVVLALLLRRRAPLLLVLLVFTACTVDPYPLTSNGPAGDGGGNGDGGGGNGDGGAGNGDGGSDAGVTCSAEVCDEVDNDCDGFIDEGFDLSGDELNCGACGATCAKAGARTECLSGGCVIHECFPGFVDLDGDTGEPFASSNGCEYACFTSNGGVEACDELDNDCDGATDEDFDLAGDESNCGECNRVCGFFHATATCAAGTCVFDPATDCDPGFIDLNGMQLDGCEYACTTSGGEVCDFVDNDCDGVIDEGFDLGTDPTSCGSCGRVCSFPNATPHCAMGACFFDPAVDCDPGFHDIDGNQLTGCEYACTGTPGGVETCNGIDDDCNGVVDGATTDSGAACNNDPDGVATGACTETGTLTCVGGALGCVGAPGPSSERCNGLDDDCDGTTDESPVDVGAVCQAAVGACSAGITQCVGGTPMCIQAIGPTAETCNGLDDDCDGTTDESPTDATLGMTCGTDTGACVAGTVTCAGGALVCSGSTGATSETCNNVDDDCDGVIDNSPIDALGPCGSDVGACVPGTVECQMGALICTGGIGASGETCNNQDDDCDGVTDEGLSTSCYTGPAGTNGVGVCTSGVASCSGGAFGACAGQVTPTAEACDNQDDDCDGFIDEDVTQSCYAGPAGTAGVGVCRAGAQSCVAGSFSGACSGQVLPSGETCDNEDDDCDGAVDENAGGTPLTQTCYSGPAGTSGVGTCVSGTQTCAFGAFGVCSGQVTPVVDRCGDGADTDCDGLNDTGEGCLAAAADLRLDSAGGAQGSAAGEFHSFDVSVASAGSPLGRRVYVVWTDKRNGNADIFLRRSTDGGQTWQNIQNLTSGITRPCVAPRVVAARDPATGNDRVYVVYQDVGVAVAGVRGLRVATSSDNGVTFADLRLDSGSQDNFHHDVAASADGTRVNIVWEQLNTASLTRTIFSRATADGGATWGGERVINVNSGAAPNAGRPAAAVTSTNRFVWVWRERRGGATQNVYATFSDAASGAIAAASEDRLDGDAGETRDADRPRLAVAGTSVYVVWEDVSTLTGGGSDVMFARTTDNAVSWGVERILDDPTGEISSSFAPAIAADFRGAGADGVWVVWEDSREGSQVYATRSLDGGATFSTPARASSSASGPVSGLTREVNVAFVGGSTVVVSYENESGGTPHVYAAASVDDGATWQVTDPRLDTGVGPATAPRLVRVDGSGLTVAAIVVWNDHRTAPGINGDPYRARIGR